MPNEYLPLWEAVQRYSDDEGWKALTTRCGETVVTHLTRIERDTTAYNAKLAAWKSFCSIMSSGDMVAKGRAGDSVGETDLAPSVWDSAMPEPWPDQARYHADSNGIRIETSTGTAIVLGVRIHSPAADADDAEREQACVEWLASQNDPKTRQSEPDLKAEAAKGFRWKGAFYRVGPRPFLRAWKAAGMVGKTNKSKATTRSRRVKRK